MRTTLLVEDAAFFEKAIVAKLHEVGCLQVMVARSFAEARAHLDLPINNPDLALVDLTLPDALNGEIVDLCVSHNVPTVIFTSRFDPAIRAKMQKKGVIDYVIKDSPSSLEYIASLIRHLAHNPNVGVLIIDDSVVERRAIAEIIAKHCYKIYEAPSSEKGLQLLRDHPDIKLVLVDYFMPNEDGFAFLKTMRRKYSRDSVAVLGMSYNDPENRIKFLKYGATDFIDKRCTPEELLLRISQNLEFIYRIDDLQQKAQRDSLTGLFNRRYFFGDGRKQLERLGDNGALRYWLALFDVDGLKTVNDVHGHAAGDEVLMTFGRKLAKLAGPNDFAVRLGGDEFCLVFCDRDEAVVRSELKQFIASLREERIRIDGKEIRLGASVGFAQIHGGDFEAALQDADVKLYADKKSGDDQRKAVR